MSSGRLLSDDLVLPDISAEQSHPMDLSRVLLGLMSLSHKAIKFGEEDSLDGVISASVLRSLLSALHFRDVTTVRHARRVALLAVGMAQHLGWEQRDLKVMEVSALLHDIGKIGIPDNILFKPGGLSPDEADMMSLHHRIGIDVLQACRVDKPVLEILKESPNNDGGSRDRLRRVGNEINLGARILAIADAYDSLGTDQVYRKARSHEEIMEMLTKNSGTQFDGIVVSALGRWLQSAGPGIRGRRSGEFGNPSSTAGPAHADEALEAGSLCHIFSYLYLLESLYDGFYLVDSDLRFVLWNCGAENLLGHSHRKMLDRVWSRQEFEYFRQEEDVRSEHESPLHEVIATGKPTTSQVRMRHADGNWKDVELQTVPLVDAAHRLQGVAEIFRDLSETKRQPAQLRVLQMAASRDPLTSVANRGELEMQLLDLFTEYAAKNRSEPFSVIFLDVDFFKSVNDRFGHSVGDEVLIEVARMLDEETYSGELVARYGGEEFVVLCPGTTLEHAVTRADRLRVAMARIRVEELDDFLLTASFGVTQVEPEDDSESILRRADKALYQAKEAGRNQTISLTSVQLQSVAQTSGTTEDSDQSFVFQAAFHAYIASDMIIYKLGGFVTDHDASLTEVTPKRIVFRMGKLGMFSYWGNSDKRRPVEVELTFGEAEHPTAHRKFNGGRIRLAVKITPIGKVKTAALFQERAGRANRELRAYFVGEPE